MTTDNVMLYDVDSLIPNLALMHVSSWKKALGYNVGFNLPDPVEIYASVIFTKNRHKIDGLKFLYPNARIDIGGTGYDKTKSLPAVVDRMFPDYSLYPDMNYDLGFTTRGCNRKCSFCFVPEKEGRFRIHQHPREFHDPAHKIIKLLDNNILFDKNWFFTVTDWIMAENMAVEFNQGIDIRLLDAEICARLKKLRIHKTLHLAFDSMDYRDAVENGLKMLKEAGINLKNIGLYVYVDSDDDFDSALTRCNILREWKTTAYVMLNPESERTRRLQDLKRWSNPFLFFKTPFEEYKFDYRRKVKE